MNIWQDIPRFSGNAALRLSPIAELVPQEMNEFVTSLHGARFMVDAGRRMFMVGHDTHLTPLNIKFDLVFKDPRSTEYNLAIRLARIGAAGSTPLSTHGLDFVLEKEGLHEPTIYLPLNKGDHLLVPALHSGCQYRFRFGAGAPELANRDPKLPSLKAAREAAAQKHLPSTSGLEALTMPALHLAGDER